MKETTAKQLIKFFRKYNTVLVGDTGLKEAYEIFRKENNLKIEKPTERQLENSVSISKVLILEG